MQRIRPIVRTFFTVATCAMTLSAAARAAETGACRTLEHRFTTGKAAGLSAVEMSLLLFSAADNGCSPLATDLIDAGASIDARDRLGARPLTHAARAGHTALTITLLTRGAPINARNLAGATALYAAVEANRTATAGELIARGADIHLGGKDEVTPLAVAAFNGNDGIAELLLTSGARPDARDTTGKTPICYAAGRAAVALVARLLDTGIDVNARYGNDLTVLMWAAGHDERFPAAEGVKTAALLLERGARLEDHDNRGRTALMIAAESNHAAMIEFLLSKGADASARDAAGKTAVDLTTRTALKERLAKK